MTYINGWCNGQPPDSPRHNACPTNPHGGLAGNTPPPNPQHPTCQCWCHTPNQQPPLQPIRGPRQT